MDKCIAIGKVFFQVSKKVMCSTGMTSQGEKKETWWGPLVGTAPDLGPHTDLAVNAQ